MAIQKKDRFFGEGIGGYGEELPQTAFNAHRKHVRECRLRDCLGKDANLTCSQIESKFDQIKLAVESADKQVFADNKDFIELYNIEL